MARRVTIDCCGCCGKPIIQRDGSEVAFLARTEFVKMEVETVRGGGGWPKYGRGSYESGPGVRLFREDVCGDCYDEIQALLEPIRELLRGGRRREEHNVPPVRDNVEAPQRRAAPFLRALPFMGR